jgi:outer membrane immunogenic protein
MKGNDDMRKIAMLAAAAAFVGVSGAASAGGLHEHESYKDEPVYAPSFTWSGFYLGGHGGGGWGNSDWDWEGGSAFDSSSSPSGGFGGIQAGYNVQIRNVVVGLEGTMSWGSLEDTTAYIRGGADNTEITWIGDASLRLGLPINRMLPYFKAGVAWGGFEHKEVYMDGSYSEAGTDNQVGWLVGGGLEYALNNNLSAKVEYNYIDFGRGSFYIPSEGYQVGADQNVSTVKGGVNYKLGAGLTPLK